MPRKKLIEPEELEQVMNPEQTGLTEENADAVPGLDESSSLGDSTGNIPEESAADGAQEGGTPPAAEAEIAGIEPPLQQTSRDRNRRSCRRMRSLCLWNRRQNPHLLPSP